MSFSKPRKINIILDIQPQAVDVGDMLQVSAIFVDTFGQPVIQDQIFMEIVDSTGRVVWELQAMERNASGFAKLISTRELAANTRYTVRVSPNQDLSPQGFGLFKTNKSKLPLALLPLVFAPIVITPQSPQQRRVPIYLVYRTELDRKVCSICRPHEGKKFLTNDPDIIKIGPPELGGETHWRCRCHYDMKLLINPAFAKFLKVREAIRAINAVKAIKTLNPDEGIS